MAEAPQPLFSRPKGNGKEAVPKPLRLYRNLPGLTYEAFKRLPHHCAGLPLTHAGLCCQMGVDNQVSAGLVYERGTEAKYSKDYLMGKRLKS